jgi:hypothetical protein
LSNSSRRYQQWRTLQLWEQRLLIKLFFLLPATWLVLRLLGFNRARRIAEFQLPSDSTAIDQTAMERAQRYAQLTSIAARHGLYKANCLHQSLALCWLLRKQGLPAQIRIGVKPNTQPFLAHAWVELSGVPLGQDVGEYNAFDRLTADIDTAKFT